jgi:hypothetical protein
MAQKWSEIVDGGRGYAAGATRRHLLSDASNHHVACCFMMILRYFYNISNGSSCNQ